MRRTDRTGARSESAKRQRLSELEAEYQHLRPLAARFSEETVRQLAHLLESGRIALGFQHSIGP